MQLAGRQWSNAALAPACGSMPCERERRSVGLDDSTDLIADIEAALNETFIGGAFRENPALGDL